MPGASPTSVMKQLEISPSGRPPNCGPSPTWRSLMVLLTVLMVIVLMMSVGALCVHLHRSVREFRAGYAEAEHYVTT